MVFATTSPNAQFQTLKPALATLAMTLLLGVTSAPQAASFDCAKAHTALEKLICGTPALDAADTRMGAAYRQAAKDFPLPGFVQATQRVFVAGYPNCLLNEQGATATAPLAVKQCIAAVEQRIQELNTLEQARVYSDATGQFTPENLAILVFTTQQPASIQFWGNWMPDAYRPKPFPQGHLCNLQAELQPDGTAFVTEETGTSRITLGDQAITLSEPISCTPRTGIAEGRYARK